MKRISSIIIAVALLLGMAQCKKQETPASEGKTVKITLNVGGNNNGSRVNVNPPHVAFEQYDEIVVARNGNSSLFLPAAGYYQNGSLDFAGRDGEYWSKSLKTDYQNTSEYGNGAIYFYLSTRDEGSCNMSYTRCCYGLSVCAVRAN